MSQPLDYCDRTRNVDDMLEVFRQEREYTISYLFTDPLGFASLLWTKDSPISYDTDCLCDMGNSWSTDPIKLINNYPYPYTDKPIYTGKERILAHSYRCAQCTNINRLIDLGKHDLSKPFTLQCGLRAGHKLMIKRCSNVNLYIQVKTHPNEMLKTLLQRNKVIAMCDTSLLKLEKAIYLGSDKFTNNVLISWVVEYWLNQIGMLHLTPVYNAFVCRYSGYCLMDHQSRCSTLSKLVEKYQISSKFCKSIILQLIAVLHRLKKIDFSHGSPSLSTLIFSKDPTSYKYQDVDIVSEMTLKLTHFQNSGITLNRDTNPVRIYHHSDLAECKIKTTPFAPKIDHIHFTPLKDGTNITVFKIDDSDLTVTYLRHMGAPLYQSAFDCYAYLVSLMSIWEFFSIVNKCKVLSKFWKSLWQPDQFQVIQTRLHYLHANKAPLIDVKSVISILSGLYLRCNVLNHCWLQVQDF